MKCVHFVVLLGALAGCLLSVDLAHALWRTGGEEDSLIWPAFAALLVPIALLFGWEAWRRFRALKA